ncbi:MAG: hypothetical protein M5R40_14355 [Anaerolineae bacterium]|nr:hypothetical protein [Anaerolineae bacterium]
MALAAWNIGLFVQYGLGLIPRDSGFAWPDVLYNQFVFLPRLAWQRVIAPLSPWSLLVIASAGALLLLWVGWRRSRAQGGRKPC